MSHLSHGLMVWLQDAGGEQKLGETQVQGRVEEWERSRKEEETLTAACKSTSA